MAKPCEDCGVALSMRNDYVFQGRHLCRACLDKADPPKKANTPTTSGSGRCLVAMIMLIIAGILFLGLTTADPTNPSPLSVAFALYVIIVGIISGSPKRSNRSMLLLLVMYFLIILLLLLAGMRVMRIGVFSVLGGSAFASVAFAILISVTRAQRKSSESAQHE